MKTIPNVRQKSLDLEQQKKIREFSEKLEQTNRSSVRDEGWHTFVYTGIICYTQMAFGASISTISPALVDLKHILKSNLHDIAMTTLFLTSGYLLGLLFGFLYKYINRQLTLIALIALTAIFSGLLPYSRQVWHLYAATFVNGLGLGVWTNGKTVWLIEMWRQRSTAVLQLSAFMYGIGTFLGPLLAKPYLTGENKIYVSHSGLEVVNQSSYHAMTNTSYAVLSANATDISDQGSDLMTLRSSKLKIPFLISAGIQVIGMIAMIAMFFIRKYETRKTETNVSPEEKLLDNAKTRKILILVLIAMFAAFVCVAEEIYLQFAATYYQYIPLRMTASEAAEIVSVMALVYTLGRGLNFFVAIKIKPQFMIAFHSTIIYVAMIILFFGQKSITVLWIGSLLMSFGFAPVYPLVFGLAGCYLEVTNKIGTMIMLSTDSLNLFLLFILGQFIDKSPNVFILSIVVCVGTSTLVFFSILYTVFRIKKQENERNQVQNKF